MKLPNLFIVGVSKAGTTSLYHYLNSHPDICGSRPKETNHFIPVIYGNKAGPLEEYQRFFAHQRNEPYIMEATPTYFYGRENIVNEIKKLGKVKIIIILRNPVDRLFSLYRFMISTLTLDHTISFEQYVGRCLQMTEEGIWIPGKSTYTGIETGKYSKFIHYWLSGFEKGSIRIYFFDHFAKNKTKVLHDIINWLDIEWKFQNEKLLTKRNVTKTYHNYFMHKYAILFNKILFQLRVKDTRIINILKNYYFRINTKSSEKISTSTRNELELYYKPYNDELRNIILKMNYKILPGWLS